MSKESNKFRKTIYEYLIKEGLELTPRRNDEIRDLLEQYAGIRNIDLKNQIIHFNEYFAKRKLDKDQELKKVQHKSYLP